MNQKPRGADATEPEGSDDAANEDDQLPDERAVPPTWSDHVRLQDPNDQHPHDEDHGADLERDPVDRGVTLATSAEILAA